jgi:hypothetical protein
LYAVIFLVWLSNKRFYSPEKKREGKKTKEEKETKEKKRRREKEKERGCSLCFCFDSEGVL